MLRFGVFDHLDRGAGAPRQDFGHRPGLGGLSDALGFHAYHQAGHHATPLGASSSPNVFLSALEESRRSVELFAAGVMPALREVAA